MHVKGFQQFWEELFFAQNQVDNLLIVIIDNLNKKRTVLSTCNSDSSIM